MRGDEQGGDVLAVSAVDDTGRKTYPLAPLPNNASYDTISLQPEAQPNQPVSARISFHGGLAYDQYDEETGGCLVNTGVLCNERNVLRAPVKVNTVTLTNAAAPPMYFFETEAPNATIAHDASDSATASSTDTVTLSFTVAAGDDRILVVFLSTTADPEHGSGTITFAGTSLTMHTAEQVGSGVKASIWTLKNPTATTGDIVYTSQGGTGDIVLGASSYTGVNLDAAFASSNSATATDQTPTVDVLSVTGGLVIDVLSATNPSSCTVDGSQTQCWNTNVASSIRGAGSREAGAGTVTMSWALGSSVAWVIIGVAMRPAKAPVLYALSVEAGEVNAYKVSLNDSDFGTLLNTKTWSGVTTPPMGRPAEWTWGGNSYWLMPLGDSGLIDALTSVAASTSNDTWSGGTDADARHLTVVKNQLYRTTGANEVSILDRNKDPETEANWGDEFYVGDAGRKITDIGSVAGLSSICKEDGVWEFDGVAEASNILPELGIAERNAQGLSFGRGGFFYPGVASLYWGLTGQPIGPDSFDDRHTANDPSIVSGQYFKHGRWNGTASYNGHLYSIYVNSLGTSALIVWAYPVGEGWRWQAIASVTADFNDFHGIYVAETSKFSASEVRPCLFFANGNDLSWIWLDKNGAPMLRRGDIDLHTSATAISGRIHFGMPRVPKQLTYISGWAEDFAATADYHQMQFIVYRDGGTTEDVGTDITGDGSSPDGYFTKHWTQDTNDECRSLLFEAEWTGTNSLTDQNGPLIRDLQIHGIAKPATTRQWNFLISASDKDNPARTSKTIRSDLEGYLNDLKKFKFPHEDAFSGMLTDLKLLRANEINELTPRGQTPPSYVFRATVRELPSS